MANEIEALIAELRTQGARQFAKWDAAVFEGWIESPINSMSFRLMKWPSREITDPLALKNYIQLVYEGIGQGLLTTYGEENSPVNFLHHCFATLVPQCLADVPMADRGRVLSATWNLGEGLAREPQWLNQFVVSRTPWDTDIRTLEKHLTTVLTPILTPQPAAKWIEPMRLQVVDLALEAPEFLPGRMALVAPAILSIEDRCQPGRYFALWLRKKGPEPIGFVPRLPEFNESFSAPQVSTTDDSVTVNGRTVETPLLMPAHQVLSVAAGFVAISSEDSQRIWLIEAA